MCIWHDMIFLYMYVCVYNIDTHCIFITTAYGREGSSDKREGTASAGAPDSQHKSRWTDPAAPSAGQWHHSDIIIQVLLTLFC